MVPRLRQFAPRRLLTYRTGVQYANADGFGISWYTDARSDFNPFIIKDDRIPRVQVEVKDPVHIFDGPTLPFVYGPHPAIYKTVMARP